MKQLLYFFLLCTGLSATAQQTVHIKLNQMMLEESFSELNDIWPVITNNDNFFVFDKGEYFMNRTKTESPYAVMAKWENDLNTFSLRASLMLGPVESINQSIGLIFRASNDGQTAVICDINKLHRFRIRKLLDGRYQTITTEGKNGWIKNNAIKGINEYNEINIRTNGSDHDVFINGILVYSFRIEDIEEGSFGLFIGPETKGRVDYVNVYADELYRDQSKIYLTDDEIRALIKENESLKIDLEQSLDARTLELQNAIRILENQLKAMRLINEQLDLENTQYAVIKSAVDTHQVDLLVDLSHKLIDNTLKNRQLSIENQLLTDSMQSVKAHFEALELELFQKVIDKNTDEQLFADSILTHFCLSDTVFLSPDSTLLSTDYVDSLNLDSISFDSLNLDSFPIEKVNLDSFKIDSIKSNDSIKLDSIADQELIPETE
ncbi:MAG: hypothetical protein L7U70_03485 [Flavobacteriales bacterium]|nr:hypothetical protein [Flavobacteriales bacterium]